MTNTSAQHPRTGRKVWTYGDEGTAYPVEVGQLWRCGTHWFYANDLTGSSANSASRPFVAAVRSLVEEQRAELLQSGGRGEVIVYSDPPWGQGNLNTFQTKAGLDRASYDWRELYGRLAAVGAAFHVKHLYIENSHCDTEVGAETYSALSSGLPQYGAPEHRAYWDTTYYHRKANRAGLYHVGSETPPAVLVPTATDLGPLQGKDDDHTPGIVMRAHGAAGIVIDPCAGRGQTSREAERSGWVSFNNELNPYRVSAALARMTALTGQTVSRVR